MYFVTDIKTWKPANKKCAEMQEYIARFEHHLIKDECSLDSMIIDLKNKAEELDNKYPRTAKLHAEGRLYGQGNTMCCRTDNSLDTNVFILCWEKVRGIYEFAEEVVKQNKIK